jgi:nitrile hydratase
MALAMGHAGAWHIDDSRYAQETLPPKVYLAVSYYQRWMLAMEKNLAKRGLVTADEMAAGRALGSPKPLPHKLTLDAVKAGMARNSFYRQQQGPARFKPGDRVLTRNIHPQGHTRLPRYVRGHVGVVERLHGCQVFPDSAALGEGDNPQWLYTVRFEGRDLWGADADPTLKVSVEAFEPYLDPA